MRSVPLQRGSCTDWFIISYDCEWPWYNFVLKKLLLHVRDRFFCLKSNSIVRRVAYRGEFLEWKILDIPTSNNWMVVRQGTVRLREKCFCLYNEINVLKLYTLLACERSIFLKLNRCWLLTLAPNVLFIHDIYSSSNDFNIVCVTWNLCFIILLYMYNVYLCAN